MKGVHTKTTNQQNWDNIYRNNFSLHVYWNNILYLKKIIKLPRYTLTLTNFSVFNLWNLKRPISQKKEFWTKFSRGSRGTCHEILTSQLIIIEKSEVVFLFKWNITEKKIKYKNLMVIILIHKRNKFRFNKILE